MLEEIKLDDRSYQKIRDDAVNSIVRHCPEWTNHNISDPGITIVELLSSMSEDVIHRLNQVPDKNYLAFLDLIGIKQRLARPSTTEVTFFMSEGHQSSLEKKDTTLIKKGSVLSTDPKGNEEPILFQTTKNLYISNIKLVNIYSKTFNTYRQRDDIVDNMLSLKKGEVFTPFSADGASDNILQIYLSSPNFEVFANSVKVSLVFRLPTTMRAFDIKDNFLQQIRWEFYSGSSWQPLNIINEHFFSLDDKDADILSVTFRGENSEFTPWVLEQFFKEEAYYIRGTIQEAPDWIQEFSVYELSIFTSSYDNGVLPNMCFHNDENLNLNNDIYPFSSRPKIDDKMKEEIFYIKSNEAFKTGDTSISIHLKQSLNPEYMLPKVHDNLRLIWEYPIGEGKWNFLKISDNTKSFTKDGIVTFTVPKDIAHVEISGEDGYWVRCRLADGNYGAEEHSEYNESTATVLTTPSTLKPPALSQLSIQYTKPREDIKECRVLNNFKYNQIQFINDMPTNLFDSEGEREEALFLAFDSYLSEDYISIYFDIDETQEHENIYTQQRVIEWQLLKEDKWVKLEEVSDETQGMTTSGNVTVKLPFIEKLEKNILYIEEYERMWIKALVKVNTLQHTPSIQNILLNTIAVVQEETYYNELLGRSDGLPDLKFELNYKNLSKAPLISVGEDAFIAVDRFIDHDKEAKVFRFNGVNGVIEFGDDEYGTVPLLGESISIQEYSITQGKRGNIGRGEISVLRESINYIDSISNYKPSINGENADSLNDLKKYAPSVLKTMDRAISIEDYELLCENFSPAIKKAKCIAIDGEVMIIPLTDNIIEDMGFINKKLLNDLKTYLKDRSLLTVEPILIAPTIVTIGVYIKLLYTIENYHISKIELQHRILENAQHYFNPLTGYTGKGFPMGKLINKADFYAIIQNTDNNVFIDEIKFSLNGSRNLDSKVNLSSTQLVKIETIMIEELSYDT
ncbi:MAG: baseplate J/gp47 family protein [Sulfurovum sp.]|nr:baseplate J/gp47 family protein [Sulfurovum sp.]